MAEYEKYIDRLFDESYTENIFIKDNEGKEIEFEQVAIVDFQENYYAVLEPVTPVEGVGEDEVMVFLIDEEKDCLVYVEDEKIIDGVNEEFIAMLEELDDED
ncbi:MAG: DUF1292 domain-containing protein [Clostridia bacterium]|nr:DUF1292 domain-containing protein [Clostridia bacterium]